MSVVYQIYADTTSGYLKVYQSNTPSEAAVLSPHLKRGANQADGFDFTMLPGNPAYDALEELKSFIYVLRDDKYVFRGRVKDIKTDIFKQRSVSCEGDLTFLGDSIQSPNTFVVISEVGDTGKKIRQIQHDGNVEMTVSQYFQSVIQGHNAQMDDGRKQFQIGQITVSKKDSNEKFEVSSYSDTSSVINSDLLDKYGGIIRTRYVNDVAYIDWLDSYTDAGSQDIRFGINMLELDEEQPNDDIWTVLLPIGKDKLTIESVNSNSKFLVNQTMVDKYGRIVHYHKFDDAKKAADLLAKAQEYMSKHCKIYPDNLTVKAVDLKLIGEATGPLQLGDKIKVVSSPHGISTTMACIEEDVDIQNPENSTYTIGTIMPPDDTKKTSMSSHQATRQRQAVRTAIQTGDAIDGLERDMDVVANNVNVNAKNIAINAENIAVNAENIAINAENITIAAETIDVQATALSVQLGDVEDDVTTTIETTAEGLKTTIGSQMSGLTHEIELLPSGYRDVVTDSEGRIKSEIVRAENSIKATFNDELYNETTGLATVLRGEISASESELRSDYRRDVYGPGGTRDNPTAGGLMAQYNSQISQTATAIQASVSETLYGSDGNGGIVAEYRSIIRQTAEKITLAVWSNDNVRHDYSLSYISLTDNKIVLSSENIDLHGYVTADQLSATNANFTRLITGQETASAIHANNFDVYQSLVVGSAQNSATFRINGTQYTRRGLKMGSHTNYYLTQTSSLPSGSDPDIGSSANFDLRHSHAVTVNSDGTITLGDVTEYNAGGSFRIADTKAYKDGVSAAINSVKVDSIALNGSKPTTYAASTVGGVYTMYYKVKLSSGNEYTQSSANADLKLTMSGDQAYYAGRNAGIDSVTISELRRQLDENGDQIADTYYHNSGNTYHTITVHTAAVASNSKIKTQDFVSDVTNVYNAVTVNSIVRQTDSSGNQVSDTYDESTHNKTVHLIAKASNGNTKTQNIVVYGTQAYNSGRSSVAMSYITRQSDKEDTYNESTHQTTVHAIAKATNDAQITQDIVVSGQSAYSQGYNTGEASVSVSSLSSRNPAFDYTPSSVGGVYTLHYNVNLSNGVTSAKDPTFSGYDAYNAGRQAIEVDTITVGDPWLGSSEENYPFWIPVTAYTSITNKKKDDWLDCQKAIDVVFNNSYIKSIVIAPSGVAYVNIYSNGDRHHKQYLVSADNVSR